MGSLRVRHEAGAGGRTTAARCQAIMAAASIVGLLVLLVGICAARMGARGMLVAIMVFYYWLAWPVGALCCGVVVLLAARGTA